MCWKSPLQNSELQAVPLAYQPLFLIIPQNATQQFLAPLDSKLLHL